MASLNLASSALPGVAEGTDAIVRLATEKPGAGSGRFIDRSGAINWS
ncbi:hypothetical protein [Streptomyces sp. NPDC002758]